MTTSSQTWERPKGAFHAHFDCFSGAAGDMLLASCLDASGKPEELLERVRFCLQNGMPELAGDFDVSVQRVQRGEMASIAALYVKVDSRYGDTAAPVPTPASSPELTSPDHSHEHGHSHSHTHAHSHDHTTPVTTENDMNDADEARDSERNDSHHHKHEHQHSHQHQTFHHSHSATDGPLRNLPQIQNMLEAASPEFIDLWVREKAIQAFTELAHAEARTHGADDIDSVHFHEVGAIDSIVDTVGTLIALHALGVTTVSCSRLPLGEGTCWGMHGLMPVPAPATLRLMVGMPTCPGPPGVTGELVTPTGAALLRALTMEYDEQGKAVFRNDGRPPCFTVRSVGHGAGSKDFKKHPNIVRLLLGNSVVPSKAK